MGNLASPAFADLDGDGDLDAVHRRSTAATTRVLREQRARQRPAFAAAGTNPLAWRCGVHFASPAFADLDGDGDLDAFVGEYDGDMLYFQNSGRSARPAFAAASSNPYGLSDVGQFASPAFADLDGDGDLDAFIGEYNGDTLYFANSGAASAPAFAAASSNPYGLVEVGQFASPAFADLDGDGDLDMFIGEYFGNTLYFENSGTASAPAFAAAGSNPFDLADVGYVASPAFADLDMDGDLDAFIGEEDGNTVYLENSGTADAPAFAAASSNPFGLTEVGRHANPTFADVDGDGDQDAFIGEAHASTVYFENAPLLPRARLPLMLRSP